MHDKLIKSIMATNNHEGIHYIEDLFDDMLENIKHEDSNKYLHIKCKLYRFAHGHNLTEELATNWTSKMKNEDGTTGAHWKVEDTEAYNPEHHNKWDWYATLNMMYSDYYNPKFTTDDYVRLANQFLDDKDASKDKLLHYYFYIVDKE